MPPSECASGHLLRRAGAEALAGRVLIAALIGYLLYQLFAWSIIVIGAVTYPDQIDYGEGVVWEQTDLLLRGEGYKDISDLPHIVFHYPPIFHMVSGLLAKAFDTEQIIVGRIISVTSTFGSLVLVGLFVFYAGKKGASLLTRLAPSLIAGLLCLTFYPITYWSPTDRVDMLAIFLSLLGAFLALYAAYNTKLALFSAVFFVAALFTKQTMIAAPLATFAVLLIARPRAAFLGLAATLVIGIAALLTMQTATSGGFLKHVVGYNLNRLDFSNVLLLGLSVAGYLATFALTATGAMYAACNLVNGAADGGRIATMLRRVAEEQASQIEFFSITYFVLTTAMIATVFKSGASFNYLIEWMFACCILVGIFFQQPLRGAFRLAAPVLLFVQFFSAPISPLPQFLAAGDRKTFESLVDMIRKADKPVISDNMVAVRRAGKNVYLEPAIIAELTAAGSWDESRFIADIRGQRFAFFITEMSIAGHLFEVRYSPSVRAELAGAYPETKMVGKFVVRLPWKGVAE